GGGRGGCAGAGSPSGGRAAVWACGVGRGGQWGGVGGGAGVCVGVAGGRVVVGSLWRPGCRGGAGRCVRGSAACRAGRALPAGAPAPRPARTAAPTRRSC